MNVLPAVGDLAEVIEVCGCDNVNPTGVFCVVIDIQCVVPVLHCLHCERASPTVFMAKTTINAPGSWMPLTWLRKVPATNQQQTEKRDEAITLEV